MTTALETRYAGHLFRSRLEARWAALFDLIGWEWTYEPLDANKYLPDFLIHGPYPFLVEVKPDDSLEELKKYVPRIDAALEGHWQGDVVIVGATPTMRTDYWLQHENPAIGLVGEYGDWINAPPSRSWDEGSWRTCETCGHVGWAHNVMSFTCRPCKHYDGGSSGNPAPNLKHLWGVAHERTRWTP